VRDLARLAVLAGNYAVAHAVKLCRPHVIAAYPITPQTSIVEKIAEFVERRELDAKYIRVESEHSAMAALIGASAAGARTFTATSSQGLLYMHEAVWAAAGARLPIVMAVVTRAIFPPWSIWTDHSDLLAQRDTGWIIAMAEDNQEAFDLVIQAYRIAEDEGVLLPVMVGLDAFLLSHTATPVELLSQEEVDGFLPPRRSFSFLLDVERPVTMGNVAFPDHYMEFRYMIEEAMRRAREVIRRVDEEYRELTGRCYGGLVERYRCGGADVVVVLMGAWAGDAKECVDRLWEEGYRVGVARLRFVRPFPCEELRELCAGRRAVIVVDRSASFGSAGVLFTEVSSALQQLSVTVRGFVAGLGGRDVGAEDFEVMVKRVYSDLEEGRTESGAEWYGVRKEVVGCR